MDEKRKLVYCDKPKLTSFDYNKKGSLNKLIFDSWLVTRTELDAFDAKINLLYLRAFNDAYYICTLALLLPDGSHLAPHSLKSNVETPAVVFPMVHLYLSLLTRKSQGIQLFLKQLETKFKIEKDWGQNYRELQQVVCDFKYGIEPELFAQRVLTKDILSATNWEQLTNTFNKKRIETIVRYYARKNEEWAMMCDAIKDAAIAYDYDYGFEEIEQDGFDDEYGPYTKIVKVPIDPYDHDGNYILEPLKRGGVYDFCDELKQRFDELVLTSQPMDVGADTHLQSKAEPSEDIILEGRGEKVSRKGRPKIAQNIKGAFKIDDHISYRNKRLEVFYDSLKNKGFIANDTDQQTFIDMFNGVVPAHKIVWVRSIKEFHYLFKKINDMKIMENTSKSMGPWQVACSCFLLRRKIKPNSSKAKEYSYEDCEITTDKIHNGGKVPKTHEELDKIIRLLDPNLNLSEAFETLNGGKDEINEMFDGQVVYVPE